VQFSEGITKIYDVSSLFERFPVFAELKDNPAEFHCVEVDVGGYGIIWNDDLDLSCDELWENGEIVQTWAYRGKEVPAGTEGARQVNKLADPNGVYQDRFEGGNFKFGPGDVKYKDLDGDGQIWYGTRDSEDPENTVENHGDKTVIGNTTPRLEYGIRLGLDFKGFDFSIFGQGIGSRKIWGAGFLVIPGFNCGDGAMPKAITTNYWTPERTDAFYPAAWNMGGSNSGNGYQVSDRYALDMSYFRIKNITLGYTLPLEITRKAYINKARFYVACENIATFDKLNGLPVDPEVISGVSMFNDGGYNSGRTGVGTPAMKNISFGIQLNF
jgi:hypothetical protein